MCDGASYSRTAEARLYNEIGTAYGANDSATFKVPDIQGRMPCRSGSHVDVSALGKNEGLAACLASSEALHLHHQDGGVTPCDRRTRRPSTATQVQAARHRGRRPQPRRCRQHERRKRRHLRWAADRRRPVDTPAFIVVNFIIVA
jgi:microcystin-dependent protein